MAKPEAPRVRRRSVGDYANDPQNINKGSERGRSMLEMSVQELGVGRSLLADKNGVLIAGNKTHEVLASLGINDVIEVETDGQQAVVVKRTDLDLSTERGRKLALADNRVQTVSYIEDLEKLAAVAEAMPGAVKGLWGEEELRALCDQLPTEGSATQEGQQVISQYMVVDKPRPRLPDGQGAHGSVLRQFAGADLASQLACLGAGVSAQCANIFVGVDYLHYPSISVRIGGGLNPRGWGCHDFSSFRRRPLGQPPFFPFSRAAAALASLVWRAAATARQWGHTRPVPQSGQVSVDEGPDALIIIDIPAAREIAVELGSGVARGLVRQSEVAIPFGVALSQHSPQRERKLSGVRLGLELCRIHPDSSGVVAAVNPSVLDYVCHVHLLSACNLTQHARYCNRENHKSSQIRSDHDIGQVRREAA